MKINKTLLVKYQKATFYGVGVGPGDPELLTIKAVRIINECEILAVPGKTKEESVAYGIALAAVPEIADKETVCIHMPMTKDEKKLKESHEKGAAQIMRLLEQGRSVAFLTLGDPTIYSTYLYLQKLVQEAGYETEIVSGVASFLAAGAALNTGLVEKKQQLHVIPSSYEIEEAIKLPGTKVLMKAGKKMPLVKEAVARMEADIYMVENCGMDGERICRDADEIPEDAGYYSLIIVKDKSEPD
ncbi:MAG: precorrin-2 C(20)-methyltransferase [bacterium]|nr:precorrin-2 C(20)-methyltransferase [bacterium]MDY4099243.1 precorrin-2 C(20)-methyltransferase [Lachnospiraceae bacterium]